MKQNFLFFDVKIGQPQYLPDGFVIGHTTKANPSINGENGRTSDAQQDYRHGESVIWKNGVVIKKTVKSGLLLVENFYD